MPDLPAKYGSVCPDHRRVVGYRRRIRRPARSSRAGWPPSGVNRRQDLPIGVSCDLLVTSGFVGSFDELALLEPTNAAATLFGHAAAMLTTRVDDGAST